MKYFRSIWTILLILSVLMSCRSTKLLTADQFLPGSWYIDSVYDNKNVEEKILPEYLENMRKIFSEAVLTFRADNTFLFSLAGLYMEGTWFTMSEGNTLITRGFGEPVSDSFSVELLKNNKIKLVSLDEKKPVIIILKKQ